MVKIPSLPGFNPKAFQQYFKNSSWLLMARVGSLLIKMIVNAIVLPNYLGGQIFGSYSYPLTILSFFMGICTLGTDSLVTRQLLRSPKLKNEILGSAFRIRLIGGLVALPLVYFSYFLIVRFAPNAPAASFAQVAFVSIICLLQSVQIIDSYFQAKVQGKYIMFVQIGGNILSGIIKLIGVFTGASLNFFIFTLVLDVLWLQIGYLYFYRKQNESIFKWRFNSKIAKHLLKSGWPLALSSIFVSLYMKIDQVMIDAMLGAEKLGVYSTVVTYSESWYFIPVALSTALFPAIMNFKKNNPLLYKKRMANLYELMVVISVSIAIIVTFIAPYLYQLLYSSRPEFLQGSTILQIHIWSGVFAFLATASSQYLIAENLTSLTLIRTLLGAVSNILLNLLLIPKMGILGAAMGTLIAYLVSAFSIVLFPKTREQGLLMIKSLILPNLIKGIFRK